LSGLDYATLEPGMVFDPADDALPARLILNRIEMPAFPREAEHPTIGRARCLRSGSSAGRACWTSRQRWRSIHQGAASIVDR
jgi:hypothetical protein